MDWDKLWQILQMLVQVLPPQIFPPIIVRRQSCLGGKMHSLKKHSLAESPLGTMTHRQILSLTWTQNRSSVRSNWLFAKTYLARCCTFPSYPGMFEARNRIRFIMEPIWTWPRTIQNNLEHDHQWPGSRFWSWPGKPVSGRWATEATLNVCLLQSFFCLSLCLVAHNQKHNQ